MKHQTVWPPLSLGADRVWPDDGQEDDDLSPDLLFSDAERTLPLLHDLGLEIKTQQPSVELMVAPLKAGTRATVKTLDKYDGDYSLLTDLARM